MKVLITPKELSGEVIVPPSKSLSHRAIIAASLANGKSVIANVLYSDDIIATIKAMRACGANIIEEEDSLTIYGSKVKRVENIIDAHESGSTIRFMIPIALTCGQTITFTGRNNLVNRPLDSYTEIFNKQGIKYDKGEAYLPMTVHGGLQAGIFEIRGDISSQFITGLLYALPLLSGDSKVIVTTPLESKGYVDLTIDVLEKFGIKIINHDYQEFIIKGNQNYKPFNYTIEGDYSQSAFWLVAGTLGAKVNLCNMNKDSYQGDKKIIADIVNFGGKIEFSENYLRSYLAKTKGTLIDFSQSPDLGPALTVLASVSEGQTTFINASRLRLKECDRITCMKEELIKMGADISELPDGMIINGVKRLRGSLELDSHNDHRIAMSLAIASLVTDGPLKINGAESVKKSYPHFFEVFESLKGDVVYEE